MVTVASQNSIINKLDPINVQISISVNFLFRQSILIIYFVSMVIILLLIIDFSTYYFLLF
jgi:hypothetical protein